MPPPRLHSRSATELVKEAQDLVPLYLKDPTDPQWKNTEVVAGDVDRVDPVHRRSVRAERAPARGPGVEAGQVEFVDQVRHARAVLVPAVEDHDRAARGAVGRRPAAIEEVDAVVGAEGRLAQRARGQGRLRVGHEDRFVRVIA